MRRPPRAAIDLLVPVALLLVLVAVTAASLIASTRPGSGAAAREGGAGPSAPTAVSTRTVAPARKPSTPSTAAPTPSTAAPGPHAYGPAVPPAPTRAAVGPDGSPATGQDPASQRQVGLAEAAAVPQGLGFDVADAQGRSAPPAPVPTTTGASDLGGCSTAYGTAGQCVPVQPPQMPGMVMTWDCATLRGYFPAGVRVRGSGSGADPWHLDGNHDGTACGTGDR